MLEPHRPRPDLRLVVKQALGALPAPVAWALFDFARLVAHAETRRRRAKTRAILNTIGWPTHVLSGPFAGMAYGRHAGQGELLPKLLGSYERELVAVWDSLRVCRPSVIIDIGAAEGYYAVGLALLLQTNVVAFELERPYHAAIRTLARSNGVPTLVDVRGECTPAVLQSTLAGRHRAFVLSDCEGAEDGLLDPDAAPGLRTADILVELHERLVPGVTSRVLARFAATHTAQVIAGQLRGEADLPPGVRLSPEEAAFATDEGRGGPMEWVMLRPRF